ncbi:MAG: hypothetical protein AVDCRST_MAG89-3488, partial [uncultured Gemmatimonadetes bacterium]
ADPSHLRAGGACAGRGVPPARVHGAGPPAQPVGVDRRADRQGVREGVRVAERLPRDAGGRAGRLLDRGGAAQRH